MTEAVCKCCGQTLPEPFEFGVTLSPKPRAILQLVYRAGEHGISTARIVDRVYADDIDGGPLWAFKAVHVQICRLNKMLGPLGWRIKSYGGHDGRYVVEKLTPTPAVAALMFRRIAGAA